MKIIGVIPARYGSSRIPNKPLADICGKPMVWWVYQQAIKARGIDYVVIATENEHVISACEKYNMNCILTSQNHKTPTSRIYEVSQKIDGDMYLFISGDEPLIEPRIIEEVIQSSKNNDFYVTNAMTTIESAPEVLDPSNIKVAVNSKGFCIYVTRSPIPFPKGDLNYKYKKFIGIGAFSKEALSFYNTTKRGELEKIEECDLMRFIENRKSVKMTDVKAKTLSVDTYKDLKIVSDIIKNKIMEKKGTLNND